MEMSLDNLKEIFFDYNSDVLLDIFEETKENFVNLDVIREPKSTEFVGIVLKNLIFTEDVYDEEESFSE